MPGRRSLREELADRLTELDGVELRPSRFSDRPAFWVGKREVAHFEPGNAMDVRLTRKGIRARKAELEADPRVTLRGSSDWTEVAFSRRAHLARVIDLVAAAVAANRT
jgi:hypothetical protein